MSDFLQPGVVETCVAAPAAGARLEPLPGRASDLMGLPIRRLLPTRGRRLIGPWCFLDGVQLCVALPESARHGAPRFEQHAHALVFDEAGARALLLNAGERLAAPAMSARPLARDSFSMVRVHPAGMKHG